MISAQYYNSILVSVALDPNMSPHLASGGRLDVLVLL